VIVGFKHKGLARYFSTGSLAGVPAQHAERLRLILGRLSAATAQATWRCQDSACTR
jgi:proteic killer suppression protein